MKRVRSAAPATALWILGLGVGALTLKDWIQLNDEGLMLQAASRISSGQLPYRDFWWFYPPGQPYLLALLWKLSGPSLVPWRVLRAVVDATVALLAWRLAGRRAGRAPALLAWAVAIFAVSSATGPHPYPIALMFALGCLLVLEKRPWLAGVLVGLVSVWRIEFAAYLGLGVMLGLLVRGGGRRTISQFAGMGVLTAGVFYIPLVLAAGLGDSWNLLIRYPVLEFGKYQTLPFPLVWDGGGNAKGVDLFAQVLSYHLPLALVLTLFSSLAALALSRRPGRWLEVATGVFGIGMVHYLVVRADAFHTGPLAVMDAVLGAWAVGAVLQVRRERAASVSPVHGLRPKLAAAAALVALAGLGWGLTDTVWKREREVRAAQQARVIQIEAAHGVKELSSTRCSLRGEPVQICSLADLEAAVRFVKDSKAGPIYVTTKRSDLVTSGAPLFYVLSGRDNVTRYDIAAPGVVTSAPVQREIIGRLEAKRALVVRYTAGITASPEPNQAGKSSGVILLDSYLGLKYKIVGRFGAWEVLEPRS
ncbi:MAG: glycosyltransferase family 87 protein [Actinomycetes bacterium]